MDKGNLMFYDSGPFVGNVVGTNCETCFPNRHVKNPGSRDRPVITERYRTRFCTPSLSCGHHLIVFSIGKSLKWRTFLRKFEKKSLPTRQPGSSESRLDLLGRKNKSLSEFIQRRTLLLSVFLFMSCNFNK